MSTSGRLSRASSTTSLTTPANNSEDESSGGDKNALSYKERRREAHTQAEQKRRDAIKQGYDYLQNLVPNCDDKNNNGNGNSGGSSVTNNVDAANSSASKVSKAAVLQKSIEYIKYVQEQKKRQEEELVLLRRELLAMQIMKKNYEEMVRAHKAQPVCEDACVPSEIKFQAFQVLMDSLFQSFNEHVRMGSFSELTSCVFSWLEEHCKPQLLQELMYHVLQQVKENYELANNKGDNKDGNTDARRVVYPQRRS